MQRLHHRLQNYCQEPAIISRHLLKSISDRNLNLRQLDQISESVIFLNPM